MKQAVMSRFLPLGEIPLSYASVSPEDANQNKKNRHQQRWADCDAQKINPDCFLLLEYLAYGAAQGFLTLRLYILCSSTTYVYFRPSHLILSQQIFCS
jgi:hypothetical protein